MDSTLEDLVLLHRDHLLGTSLDLAVCANAARADAFLAAVLVEVERRDSVFSNGREDTPITALRRGATVAKAPTERLPDPRQGRQAAGDTEVPAVARECRRGHRKCRGERVPKGPQFEITLGLQKMDARVAKSSDALDLVRESRRVLALFFDLHPGKSGGMWWIVIDLAGVLGMLVALTGLVLWLQLKERRRVGPLWLGVGSLPEFVLFAALAP